MRTPRWLDRRIAAAGPYLTLCLGEEDIPAIEKKLGAAVQWPSSGANCTVLVSPTGLLTCVVCIADWRGRDPVEVAGLLVHEAVHVWQHYADDIGENNPGTEQEAYAIQAIAQELMAEFARRMTE